MCINLRVVTMCINFTCCNHVLIRIFHMWNNVLIYCPNMYINGVTFFLFFCLYFIFLLCLVSIHLLLSLQTMVSLIVEVVEYLVKLSHVTDLMFLLLVIVSLKRK